MTTNTIKATMKAALKRTKTFIKEQAYNEPVQGNDEYKVTLWGSDHNTRVDVQFHVYEDLNTSMEMTLTEYLEGSQQQISTSYSMYTNDRRVVKSLIGNLVDITFGNALEAPDEMAVLLGLEYKCPEWMLNYFDVQILGKDLESITKK